MPHTPFDLAGKSVFVAGHRGMVGSALLRRLAPENATLLTAGRAELDLLDQAAVNRWFAGHRPQVVFVAAARVGGIAANNALRGQFIYENLAIITNIIHAAYLGGAEKLMIDATHLKVHRTAASLLKKGLYPDVSDACGAA